MYWTDIELDQMLPDHRLRSAFAEVFQVPLSAIVATDLRDTGIQDPWAAATTRIVLDRWVQLGEFPLHLTILLRGFDDDERVGSTAGTLKLLIALCRTLGSRGIVGMSDEDPFVATLLLPNGAVHTIRLDPDALDEDRLVLSSSPALSSTARHD